MFSRLNILITINYITLYEFGNKFLPIKEPSLVELITNQQNYKYFSPTMYGPYHQTERTVIVFFPNLKYLTLSFIIEEVKSTKQNSQLLGVYLR